MSDRTWPQWAWVGEEKMEANWGAPIKWQHTKWHGASCQQLSIHPMSKGFSHLNESTHCQRSLRAEERRAGKAQEEGWERGRADFHPKVKVVSLCSSIPLVSSHIESFFLEDFSDLLTSKCYTIMQLSRLSWPHVLSGVNLELMSMALSSTRCSALWLNTC